MITVMEKDITRKVIYTERGTGRKEEGQITSFNDSYVFVKYNSSSTPQATRREDLTYV